MRSPIIIIIVIIVSSGSSSVTVRAQHPAQYRDWAQYTLANILYGILDGLLALGPG